MRTIKAIFLALVLIGISNSADAQSCSKPAKVRSEAHITVYRAKNSVTACLSNGRSIKVRALAKNKVRVQSGSLVRDYKVVSPRKITVGKAEVQIQGIVSSNQDLTISVEVTDHAASDIGGVIFPRVCPQLEIGACYMLYAPVCGQDPLGNIKAYSNDCFAAVDCAVIVNSSECGL